MRRYLVFLVALAIGLPSLNLLAAEPPTLDPREVHLADLQQLTFGGENAEGYWSPDGKELILQSTHPPYACDQIFRLSIDKPGELRLVSTGKGRTTCSYFFYPKAERILYASTHLSGDACPPPPDRSQGYVWSIDRGYEIFTALPDGSDLKRLTENNAYDAEATVCPLDGSVIFTSSRDGDLDLYRMDAEGGNVRRLTDTPGYDGGAFFSADCKQIVWRASRFKEGKELDDYKALLARDLVRPSRLDLFVAEADGTHARQVTYLDSGTFAPFFFPDGKRILFSTNYPNPRGREFDLWAVDVDGSNLERITYTAEFDGFPMFSPDGKSLVFASNRNNAKEGDTNLFLARWVETPGARDERAADRFIRDVRWLADDERQGRGIGTQGLKASADWLTGRFAEIGLAPAGVDGYRQSFEVVAAIEVDPATSLTLDGQPVAAGDFLPAAYSAQATVEGEVVAAGYGVTSAEHDLDDYAGLDVQGKIVLVRRFVPAGKPFDDTEVERRLSDLRYKAFNARQHGAKALLVVDLPAGDKPPEEAPLPKLAVDGMGDAGIPVVVLTRAAGAALFSGRHRASLEVKLLTRREAAENILGRVEAGSADRLPGTVVVGAHYDHLGLGHRGSLAPDSDLPHNGADDNASGTAALLEAARTLVARRGELKRDVIFAAFSAEESGVLGSSHLVKHPTTGLDPKQLVAMINMDMVGRLSANRLSVLGAESAAEWRQLVPPLCDRARLSCELGGDGYGPSDQMPFYGAGVPVLHLFTGVHDDYHKPSDDSEKINAAGGAQVAELAAAVAFELAGRAEPLTYKQVAAPPPAGDVRSYGGSLGVIPDYAAPESVKGVLLAGARPGGPADAAGMKAGDVLVELSGHPLANIYDYMFVLRQSKPGDKATAVVERQGQRLELVVTFGVSRGRV